MINEAIRTAIDTLGSQKKLADACGISQPSVWAWLHGVKKISPEHVKSIVDATNGKVKAYQLRPDLPKLFPKQEQTI